jgi:uncharacterized protein with PIN domain
MRDEQIAPRLADESPRSFDDMFKALAKDGSSCIRCGVTWIDMYDLYRHGLRQVYERPNRFACRSCYKVLWRGPKWWAFLKLWVWEWFLKG